MNILALMPYYPSNAPRFLVDAFERLGHRVFRIGPTYFDHYGLTYNLETLPKVDIVIPKKDVWPLDTAIEYATQAGVTPDLIFVSEEDYQNEITPTKKVPVVLYSCDGWPNCYERINTIQPTMAYTNHPLGVKPAPRATIPDGWKFLPGAADSFWDRPQGHGSVAPFDFSLLATMYGQRETICRRLSDMDFSVGYGQADLQGYRDIYTNSLSTYHNCNGQAELKWRLFSSMSMGCINICDRNVLFGPMGYRAWEHYVPVWDFEGCFDSHGWPSPEGVAEAIRWLKRNQGDAHRIARLAQERTLKYDCYENRARLILSDLGLAERNPEVDWDYDHSLRQYMKDGKVFE